MYCAVYKSSKKADTYLYIETKDKFDRVPKALLSEFGEPHLVMVVDISKRDKLAQIATERLQQVLLKDGFYLQLPPPPINLLDEYKQAKSQQ
uniref:YcgL domain-containing protein n=1 Tax=Thaumasiovibrio occultus TaxID=1891184 RepID=UPI000B360A4C|nr:YcgL domain-containing protein [Thaumasiovibrio occultus]